MMELLTKIIITIIVVLAGANALPRKNSEMEHFDEPAIRESKIMELIDKIQVNADSLLEKRRQAGVHMRDTTRDGGTLIKGR